MFFTYNCTVQKCKSDCAEDFVSVMLLFYVIHTDYNVKFSRQDH